MFLDRLQAKRTVVAAAGQHNTDRMLGLVLGERGEKHIDWCALSIGGTRSPELQPPFADRQDGAGRQDIDVLGLDLFAVLRVDDWHTGRPAEYLGEHAFAVGRQMCENHKCQPVTGWKGLKELLQRFDTTGRGTYADDGEAGHHDFSPS